MDELLEILGAEASEYRQLLPLVEEEERVLVSADVPGLLEVSARREAAIARLGSLERKRRAVLARLAAALGVDPKALTVSRLRELAPAHARALSELGDELRALLGPMLARHGRNRFVAEHTLGCLRGLLAGIALALVPAPAYTRGGQSTLAVEGLSLLDRRA